VAKQNPCNQRNQRLINPLFKPASEKGHFDGLVDEGKSQSQKLTLRTALAKNTKPAKNKSASISVNLRLISFVPFRGQIESVLICEIRGCYIFRVYSC